MDPASVRGYDNLGLTYDMMGLTDEAQAAFARAVALNRQSRLRRLRGRRTTWVISSCVCNNSTRPEANLREALKYEPQFALAHYHLARVLEFSC